MNYIKYIEINSKNVARLNLNLTSSFELNVETIENRVKSGFIKLTPDEREYVSNISYVVRNIEEVLSKVDECLILQNISVVDGKKTAIIKSIIPNLLHTLYEESHQINQPFDHITIACDNGKMNNSLEWYKHVFDMENLVMNTNSLNPYEFIVNYGKKGMNLKALRSKSDENYEILVFVEPLEFSTSDQISRFLKENSGPGVQHIALKTNDICKTIEKSNNKGFELINVPSGYYQQLKLPKGFDKTLEELEKSSILVDFDEFNTEPNYILQTFTLPIFPGNSLFFEVIQRLNCISFGARNIIALWKSVDPM